MRWKKVPTKNSMDERGDETFEKKDVVKALALCFQTIV
jgi:hypothetical protein